MRIRGLFVICVLSLSAFESARAGATPPAATLPASPSDTPEATLEARRHFKVGIRLYQDTNYAGALVEFEAAYAAKPGPGSLQNVALCQKALFRYREAAATLEQLLAAHAAELNAGEKKAVSDAITELHGLVGSLVVDVEPSDAKVTLDGRALAASELHVPVEVNVGEHSVVADASGYARLARVVNVASGQQAVSVELKLKATDGFLSIVATDPRAAIAVDGVTRAFQTWKGGVEPDEDHFVQVFRDGYESYESTVKVGLGKTLEVHADLGARIAGAPLEAAISKPGVMPAPPPRHVPKGFYGLLTLGVLGLGQHPLSLTSTRSGGAMGTIGLRAGYRIAAPIAAELMLDAGKLSVDDAKSSETNAVTRQYTLSALRFGPNLRLMTTGKKLRFFASIGTGVVRHQLDLDPVAGSSTLTGGKVSGLDPYFLLELGLEWSLGRVLLGAEVVTLIDGASNLNEQKLDGDNVAFGNTDTLPLFGLSLHGGYSSW